MLRNLLTLVLCLITYAAFSTTLRYRLALRDDPSTSVVIGWEQDGGTGAQVYYGTVDHGQNWSLYPNVHGADRAVTASGMDNEFARLTGLVPNTAYYFVIKDSDGVSDRFWFKTTPLGNAEPISIIAGGDSRAYLDDSPREAANLMVSKLRPDLVMFGGDYTWLDTGIEWQEWMDDWQLTTTADGKMVPVVWERGNHELSSGKVINMFDIPSTNDEYYAITVGGNFLRIYTLNTEISVAGNQATWLENDLAANAANHDWSFAQYHTCMRPHSTDKSNGDAHYAAWAEIFYDYGVQLIVESDAHDVKTTWPVKPDNGLNSDEGFKLDTLHGSVYIGEGCWGAPLRTNDDDKDWTRNSGSFNSFHWMKIGKDTIEIRTVATDNSASVGSVTDNDKFTPPAGINLWNPSNGDVVYIRNHKYINRPDVDVTYPAHQQYFSQPQMVTINATATDLLSTVTEVKFYINDVYIGNDLTAPYSIDWTIPNNGNYIITAFAVNAEGWHNISEEVSIYSGDINLTNTISTDNDDAEERKDDGSVDLTSSDLELCVEDWAWPLSDEDQWVGLRFQGIEIPQGANILNAYIQFTADESENNITSLTIYGQADDNALPFNSTSYNVSPRPKTNATVSWQVQGWNSESSGINERTPNLTSVVSEITSRAGWTLGNSMVFLIEGNGSGTRSAYSRDNDANKAPKLFVEFNHNTTGLQDALANKENPFKVYPNPTADVIYIENFLEDKSTEALHIYDINGSLVYSSGNNIPTSLNLKSLGITSGVYIITLGNHSNKIIVQ